MDYTQQSRRFQLRKAARYTRLYGPRRTLMKVEAEYHTRRRFDELPQLAGPRPQQHVGIIGCGRFAFAQIAYYLRRGPGRVIRGVMDIDVHRAASLARRHRAGFYTDDAAEVIDDPAIDLVYIASNHASHAEYAIQALERGKHVHIEKPHVVTLDQLQRLCLAMESSGGEVRLGFNRPDSRIGLEIREALAAESGPAMLNWFIAGHELPADHWYFRPEEGGRTLGNLCHWTDFVLRMVAPEDRHPITIQPVRADSQDDIVVNYVFGDGTMAAITFSAKGHAFEGVRERFAAHRGDTLISMDDFQRLTIERGADKRRLRLRSRDHGHHRSILDSYALAGPGGDQAGLSSAYVWETGELFLRTREALEDGSPVTVEAFSPGRLGSEPVPG